MLNEATDIASLFQLFTIFRYLKDGHIQKIFLGFSDMNKNCSATGLSEHVFKVLENFQCADKLVAQKCDETVTCFWLLIVKWIAVIYENEVFE